MVKPTVHQKRSLPATDPQSSRIDHIGGAQQSKKRARLTTGASVIDVPEALSTVPMQVRSSVGCRWSTHNWSCAYDSVFMALFYIFRGGSMSMQESWRRCNTILGELASSFTRLMLSDESLRSADLFDLLRDSMRDNLTAMDPVSFPRHGLHFASAGRIMDSVFPDNMPILMCMLEEGTSPMQQDCQLLNFRLPLLCTPVSWMPSESGRVSLQDWIMAFLQRECDKLRVSNFGASASPELKVVLQKMPTVLFFEVVSTSACAILPSVTLILPSRDLDATYHLRAILYSGSHHFTARMFFGGLMWMYDGRVNGGCPIPNSPGPVDSDAQYLSHLDGRAAHILVYVLQ
ncbi:hypothetical protein F4604DRAFT_1689088 [Suillus subluteus]|nr:hypothetical protein F4604DRAFT_1689088 [Suillus subluteus]